MHRNDANTADIIWDMYSDNPAGPEPYTYTFGTNQCGNYGQEGDCYNREHSFPQSWFNSASPMKSDLHHLFPTDGKVNGMRDNNPYGEVSAPTWTSQNGGKLGPNTYPGFSGTVFEPRNEYKGDFARGQLYMVTRYESQVAGWQGNGNANDVLNGTAYPAFDDWYIKLMYKWHQQDPVSQKEIDRNNAVYALQGNRNPFIDHPEYVFDVWNCTGVIPVTLLDFSATKNNKSVLLVWHTAQETNFKKYVVERSIDGRNFFSLGEIMGRNLGVYDFTDNNLPDKTWAYYRLKMINADGSFTFSYIVSVRLSKNFSGSVVYPNPAKDVVQIKLQQSLTEVSNLIITDISGRNMLQRKISSGQNSISLNVNNLSAGRYFVTIRNSSVIIQDNFTLIK
jgi:endonuclease I